MLEPAIYISYSSTERELARRLANDLEAQGIRVLWDELLRPGKDWREMLWDEVLPQASLLVVLVSPQSAQSKHVYFEVQHALRTKRDVIPVIVNGDYSLLQELGLSDVYGPTLHNTDDSYQSVLALLIKAIQDFFLTIRERLYNIGFTERFVNSLREVGTNQQSQALTIYYDANIGFEGTASIQRELNRIAVEVMATNADFRHLGYQGEKILVVDQFSHPSSTKIILDIASELVQLIGSETAKEIYLGLVVNALYDVLKSAKKGLVFAASRLRGEWVAQDIGEVEGTVVNSESTAIAVVEEVTTESFFMVMRGGDVLVGWQEQKVVRTQYERQLKSS